MYTMCVVRQCHLADRSRAVEHSCRPSPTAYRPSTFDFSQCERTFSIVDIPPYLTYVATLPCETWMTEKPTKFTVFLKTSESQHSAVKYFDKCFSRCLLCNTTTSPDLFKQMFKMSPFGFHTSKKRRSRQWRAGRQLRRLQQCVHAVRCYCW